MSTTRAVERDLRLILDSVPALVNTVTPTGEIDFANRQLLDYLGVSREQLQDWQPFIHEADRAMVIERWKHSIESGQPFGADYRLRRSDGVYRWFHGHAVPVRTQDGSIVRWCNLVTDIEERKQAEDLRRSSERHAILDNIPGLVAIHKASGEPELFNRAAREYHGPCADDPKQWKITDVIHPDDLPWLLPARRRAVQTRQPFDTEPRMRRADGTYRWFLVRAVLVDDYDGTSRWYSVRTDIHDRKMAEDALRQSEAFLLEVQRLSRTGGWRYDLATDVVESSPEIQRAYAVQPGEDISRPAFWFDRIHPEDRPRVQALFEQCIREKTDYRAGYRIVLARWKHPISVRDGPSGDQRCRRSRSVHRCVNGHDGALAGDHRAGTRVPGRPRSSDQDVARSPDRHGRRARRLDRARSQSAACSRRRQRTRLPAMACPPRRRTFPRPSRRPNGSSRTARTLARSFGGYAPCSSGRPSRKCRSISARSLARCFACSTAIRRASMWPSMSRWTPICRPSSPIGFSCSSWC